MNLANHVGGEGMLAFQAGVENRADGTHLLFTHNLQRRCHHLQRFCHLSKEGACIPGMAAPFSQARASIHCPDRRIDWQVLVSMAERARPKQCCCRPCCSLCRLRQLRLARPTASALARSKPATGRCTTWTSMELTRHS